MKNRKKNTKLVLLVLLVCITLGYAALRTGLNINGTANVSSSSWNVYFSNYQMSNATNITPTTEPEIVGTTTTSISYEVDLDVPGDIYEFSVEVVNGGSLDANISLVSKYNGTEIDAQHPVPEYITYTVTDENGDPIVDNHRLNHGDSEIVKVFVKYRDDDASVLPAQDAPGLSFDIEIEAEQAPKATPPASNIAYVVNSADMYIGQSIPNEVNIRTTPAQAMADWVNISGDEETRPYYLKFILNGNDEITESYVEFVIDDDLKTKFKSYCDFGTPEEIAECMASVDNILVNGTYTLRGGVDETSLATGNQPIFEANVAQIKAAFNYASYPERCTDNTNNSYHNFYCNFSDLNAYVNLAGDVTASDTGDTDICYSNGNGSSYCVFVGG